MRVSEQCTTSIITISTLLLVVVVVLVLHWHFLKESKMKEYNKWLTTGAGHIIRISSKS